MLFIWLSSRMSFLPEFELKYTGNRLIHCIFLVPSFGCKRNESLVKEYSRGEEVQAARQPYVPSL